MKNGEELVVRVVELVGNAYQNGVAQGEEINSTELSEKLDLLRVMTRNVNAEKAKGILQDISPGLLQELKGMADAMKIGFEYSRSDL